MAAIDDLIAQIEDRTLRERLRTEAVRANKSRKFGLVFEDHLPELTPIYSAKVRKYSKVALRNGPLTDLWRVLSVQKGTANCRNIASGEMRQIPSDELVVVRQFGESIFPALVPVGKVKNGSDDAPWHTLIEADNYHALQLLEYAYAGQIDCIYIDPPYNTGARDWKYNNDFVDANDRWRHSKWLAMMQRRLKLAKRLLNPKDSVLIVTIDEKEYLRLGLLLEQIFPEATVQMVTSTINPKGTARTTYFSRTDEFIFFVFVGDATVPNRSAGGNAREVRWRYLRRTDVESARGTTKGGPAQFYPIYVNNETGRVESIGLPLPHDEPRTNAPTLPNCTAVFPIREEDGMEMNWGLTRASLQKALDGGFVRISKNKSSELQPYVFSYLTAPNIKKIKEGKLLKSGKRPDGSWIVIDPLGKSGRPTTNWKEKSHEAGAYGTSLVRALLPGRKFPFPKSVYAVEDALRFFVADKPEAIILDFFAGSGTTAHAVMRLNRLDSGRRRCISVTNNEVAADEQKALRTQGLGPGQPEWERRGICQNISFPRLKAAITGKTPEGDPIKGDYKFNDEFPMAKGFSANLEYFRLDFLDKDHVALSRQFREILPILWLRAGAIGPRPEIPKNKPIPQMLIPEHSPFAVLVDETRFADFVSELEQNESLTHVYLVTDSEEAFHEMAAQLNVPNVIQLYRDYLENFVINTGEGAQ